MTEAFLDRTDVERRAHRSIRTWRILPRRLLRFQGWKIPANERSRGVAEQRAWSWKEDSAGIASSIVEG